MPLAIDIYCGLGGWSDGLLSEGWDVIGFDLERHDYGTGGYTGKLVLQDARTLHGSQFKTAALIVASPPCQFFSYCAMPWSRAKQLAAEVRNDPARLEKELELFNACFRIQREAWEAAGRYIPLIVENVVGAQAWVGPAKWHYGSFYLWGDVPALMPFTSQRKPQAYQRRHGTGSWFAIDIASSRRGVTQPSEIKTLGHVHTRHLTNQRESDAVKGADGGWFNDKKRKGEGPTGYLSQSGSKSDSRKTASAHIAKIPFPLARHIARCFKPQVVEEVCV